MKDKNLLISVIITFIYAVITLITVLHHEVWTDEAQSWLLCKNLSFIEVFKLTASEGHPVFFYLLIFPFAKIFDNIIWMKLVCWTFMCASVFILMRFSKFSLYTKASVILSSGFLYFLPVLARSYSIIPLLLFLAAVLYSKSKQHPVLYVLMLVLISNALAVLTPFCICLAAVFFIENRKHIFSKQYMPSFILAAAGILIPVISIALLTKSNVFFVKEFLGIEYAINSAKRIISLFFLNSFNYDMETGGILNLHPSLNAAAAVLSAVLFVVLLFFIYKNSKKLFICAAAGIGFQFFTYIFIYGRHVYVTRIFMAYLIILFCLWIILDRVRNNNKIINVINAVLAVFFAITFLTGAAYTISDIKKDYTGAKEAAEFIRKNINPETSVILTDNEPYIIPLVYYLKDTHKIYSVFRRANLEYVIWDKTAALAYDESAWKYYIKDNKKEGFDYYFINAKPDKIHNLEKTQSDYFDLIYKSENTVIKNDGFRIFKYKLIVKPF